MNTRSILQLCFATAMLVPASADAVPALDRIGDSGTQAGIASAISVAGTDTHHLMTALANGNGLLEVIRWDVDPSGTVTRVGSTITNDVVSATAIDAGILPGGTQRYWANVVNTNGTMKLILWGLSSTGPVVLDQDTGGTIKGCDVAVAGSASSGFDPTYAVLLCQSAGDAVTISAWSVDAKGHFGTITSILLPPGSSSGALPKLAYLGADANDATPVFLAAYRDFGGNLRVGTYRVDTSGFIQEEDVHNQGAIDGLAVGSDGAGNGVIAVRTSTGDVETTVWTQQSNNDILPGLSATNGKATGIAAGFAFDGLFATAGRDAAGNLDVDLWQAGQHLIDTGAGAIQSGRVGMASMPVGTDGRVFTAVSDGNGNLKLIVWRVSK